MTGLRLRIATAAVQRIQAAVDQAAYAHDQALRRLAEVKADVACEELQRVLDDFLTVLRSRHSGEDLAAIYDRFIVARDGYLDAWLELETFQPVWIEVQA